MKPPRSNLELNGEHAPTAKSRTVSYLNENTVIRLRMQWGT